MGNNIVRQLASALFTPDDKLMWRVRVDNDHRAFAQLVERWEGPIWHLCFRMIGDAHRAEDLTQDAFARVFEKREGYRPTAKFSTYLWRVALNLCYDELRRASRRRELALEDGPADAPPNAFEHATEELAPDERAARSEESDLVRQALMKLPELYRTVVVLRHYQNLKLREIAQVLELPEGTVHSRLAEGYSRLTKLIEPELADTQAGDQGSPSRLTSST